MIEKLESIGYEIYDFNKSHEYISKKQVFEILLWPVSFILNPFSKDILINLVEVFSALKYGIVKYELLNEHKAGEIKFIVQSL